RGNPSSGRSSHHIHQHRERHRSLHSDGPDPVHRLAGLLRLHELYFGEGAPEERLEIVGEVHDNLCAILIAQEYLTQSEASDDQAFDDALERFIGNENFEERADISAGWIDEPVYAHLLKKFEG
ncbi:MAG: putative peptidoglycan binding domain-containing protein, partial [Anaerolineales bacterium]